MATPRKHWFRVADSILFEGWSDSELATMVRLSAFLNTRWARDGKDAETAGRVELDLASARLITGKSYRPDCLRALESLAARLSLLVEIVDEDEGRIGGGSGAHRGRIEGTLGAPPRMRPHRSTSCRGAFVSVSWPKWPEFQAIVTRELPGDRLSISPSGTPPPPPPQTHKNKTLSTPAAPARAPSVESSKGKKPETFMGPERERIYAWAQRNGFGPEVLNAGMILFREWVPLKNATRTSAQWVAAFMQVVREGVRKGQIQPAPKPGGSGGGGARSRPADEVIAEAKRKAAEDDERARRAPPDDAEAKRVAALIEQSMPRLRVVRPAELGAEVSA
jgi:hypothetical protein